MTGFGSTGFTPVQAGQELANNNSVFDLKHSASGVWLLGAGLQNLANNNVLVSRRLLADNGKRTMLTTDQINDLHRLYWSEHWPIRKIERHLRMSGEPSRSISMRRCKGRPNGIAKANSILSKPPSPNGWRRTPAQPSFSADGAAPRRAFSKSIGATLASSAD